MKYLSVQDSTIKFNTSCYIGNKHVLRLFE